MAKIKFNNLKGQLVKGAVNAAGGLSAAYVNKFLPQTLSPEIRGAIKIAAGVLIPAMIGGGKKRGIAEDFGAGMTSVGIVELANATVFKSKPIKLIGVGDAYNEIPMAGVAGDNYSNIELAGMENM